MMNPTAEKVISGDIRAVARLIRDIDEAVDSVVSGKIDPYSACDNLVLYSSDRLASQKDVYKPLEIENFCRERLVNSPK